MPHERINNQMFEVKGLNYNAVPLRIISAKEFHPQVKVKFISLKNSIIFFWILLNGSLSLTLDFYNMPVQMQNRCCI